ncbi:MAG: gliding motility-associated C-terminal domain-containing protein [Saprospiraceae bacterium]
MLLPCWRFNWSAILAAFWLLGCAGQGMAQPLINWDRTLGGERYEELNGQLILPDGILISGTSSSNMAFGDPNDFSLNFFIAKLDFDGNVLWRHLYGGLQDERIWALVPTPDGGFLAGGYSESSVSGDRTQPTRGSLDVWLIKIDGQGNLLWDKAYGGLYRDELFAIRPMPDGSGYLLGCHSWSDISGEKSEPARGLQDFWILRIDNQGNLLWDKTIGGDDYEQINDLEWAADGNVYLSGGTISDATGDLGSEPTRGGMDFLLIKFNPVTRQVVWVHRYGGAGEDYPYAFHILRSGNLLMGGRSASAPAPPTAYNNGKDATFYGGDSDYWMIELSPEGQKLQEWSFGGTGLDDLYAIQENEVGQLVLGGVTDSDVSGNKTATPHGGYDYWFVGLNKKHQKTWELTVGGSMGDALTQISRLTDGSLVFGGHSESNVGFDKTQPSAGLNDFWVLNTFCETTAHIVPAGPAACDQRPVQLRVDLSDCDSCCVIWSNGSMESTIEVPGDLRDTIYVAAFNEYGCIGRDTFVLQPVAPPAIQLGPAEITIIEGNIQTLGVSDPALLYHWNTGASSATIQVSAAGVYAVTVTNADGCTATDQIQLRVLAQTVKAVWVPNVFSPNDDGVNDYVSVYTNESVRRVVSFQIADRWGDLCFRHDDYPPLSEQDGWDGDVRHQPAAMGVYAWFVEVEYTDGKREVFEGNLTLLR